MPDEIATLLPPLAQPTAAVKEVLDSWFNIGGGRCTDVCREIFTAKLAKVNEWEKISVGDVVMMRSGEIGEVLFLAYLCINELDAVVCHVKLWQQRSVGVRASKYNRTGRCKLYDAEDVLCSLVWAGQTILTVLHPTLITAVPR